MTGSNPILLLAGVEYSERCTLRTVMPPGWRREKEPERKTVSNPVSLFPGGENRVASARVCP